MVPLPAPAPGVVAAPLGPRAVVFEPVTSRIQVLNPAAAVVWDACEQGWPLRDLVDAVVAASGADRARVTADVEAGLSEFGAAGLVLLPGADGAASPGGRPGGSAGEAGSVAPPRPLAPVGVVGALPVRRFAVVDEVVALRSADEALLGAAGTFLADLATDAAPTVEWVASIGPDRSVRLSRPGRADLVVADRAALLDALPTALNQVAAATTTCLTLHAGAVRAPDGRALLLPAVSGSGKSTLAAALVRHGWGYVTDEAVGVRAGSLAVVRYPKPLSLGPASRGAVGLDPAGPPHTTVAELGGTVAGPDLRVGGIVLPTFRPGARAELVALDEHAAVLAVAEHALNLRHTGREGVAALADLARSVPCQRLVHGGAADAVHILTSL